MFSQMEYKLKLTTWEKILNYSSFMAKQSIRNIWEMLIDECLFQLGIPIKCFHKWISNCTSLAHWILKEVNSHFCFAKEQSSISILENVKVKQFFRSVNLQPDVFYAILIGKGGKIKHNISL